ncbi:MAG: acetyl-CoA C-acetyltransferase [Ardenticatenales bacterium]|nr:acetyl-CoA C-acetyltransferase [Ardenticatenales bacterium]
MTTNGNQREPVIVSAVRTPIGRFQGSLSTVPATELGGIAIREALSRAGVAGDEVDEVLMGNVVQAGEGQAPARQALLKAGLPDSVSATTINKVCGSGLKTVMMAASAIKAGDGDIFVAGGMENMNQAPYLLPNARFGYRLGNGQLLDSMIQDGLWCAVENQHMGNSAEWIAREYEVTREEQDAFALRSHQRATAAIEGGKFDEEIVPVEIKGRKGTTVVDKDEAVRPDSSLEALAKLRPAFEEGGTVTAGNAPGITDGASAVVVMSRAEAEARGIKPLARIVGYAQAGVAPLAIFSAPIYAVKKLAEQMGVGLDHWDLIEMNEAFAAQCLADLDGLGIESDNVNVNGGAIALGHPIGASGTRVLTTLIYALKDRGLRKGLATLCLGGGEAVAMAIELEG